MLHYRGITFCSASRQCSTEVCDRKVTPEVEAAAEKWWGKPGAPFAFSDYSTRCGEFQPITQGATDGATQEPG